MPLDPRDLKPARPATGPQVDFITRLLDKTSGDLASACRRAKVRVVEDPEDLSVSEASAVIDVLQGDADMERDDDDDLDPWS